MDTPQAYRIISLTQGQVAIVDAEDYERIAQSKWYAQWIPDTKSYRAVRGATRDGKRVLVYMSREVMIAQSGILVDHRNHDTLDNRRQNLRLATRAQNQWNHRLNVRNRSGFKGVSQSRNGKWQASIQVNGKSKSLGSLFDTKEDASLAYQKAAVEFFGQFAHW